MELVYESNRIYSKSESGDVIAEVTFPSTSSDVVNIDHTFVHESLRGQGIASKLMSNAAERIRTKHWKATATCPYAAEWFSKHPEYAEIYIQK